MDEKGLSGKAGKQKRTLNPKRIEFSVTLAQMVGLEPTCPSLDKTISSFMKCVSGSVSFVLVSDSFVLGAKPHKHCILRTKTPKKPVISGKFE
ncbi:hypothetical protein [Massiliimalia timonensis]|uniref:hypothetical protein n=1 Tax=Massiliimalia timonensis TaxID=1987501 RepID=UPI0018A03408|nr:hypothetical protein [Massiliimalia timonensis]